MTNVVEKCAQRQSCYPVTPGKLSTEDLQAQDPLVSEMYLDFTQAKTQSNSFKKALMCDKTRFMIFFRGSPQLANNY